MSASVSERLSASGSARLFLNEELMLYLLSRNRVLIILYFQVFCVGLPLIMDRPQYVK